jgi:RNA polymerase sigma-70 factor (ECF subfamily)
MSESGKIDSSLWVERYADRMYRFALARVRNADAAEEIVQAAFLAALQSQGSFAGQSSEKTWLFGILKHKIMDYFRELKKRQSLDLAAEDVSDSHENAYNRDGTWKTPPGDWGLDPEKAAENKQLAAALLRCMEELSDKLRRILILREVDGRDTDEICKDLGIQPTNLWVILHRARSQMRKCLEIRWFKNTR